MTNYDYVAIVNAVNASVGGMYAYKFPIGESLDYKAMSAALLNAPPNIQNAYIDTFRNLIVNTLVKKVYRASNPFRFLYREDSPLTQNRSGMAQEVSVDQFIPMPYEMEGDADRFFASNPPKVIHQYMCNILRKKYVMTLSVDMLAPALESPEKLDELINRFEERMNADMEEDDKEEIMAAIDAVLEGGNMYIVPMVRPTDSTTALAFSTELEIMSYDLSFRRSRKYNLNHLSTKSSEQDAVMIVAGDVISTQNNYNLAWAFNRSYLDLAKSGQIVKTDSLGMAGNKVFMIYTDRDFFRIHNVSGFPKVRKWENDDNLEEKKWVHVWKMVNFSYSSNAIAFVEPADIGVESVELLTMDGKTTATVEAGKWLQMGIPKVTPQEGKIADAFVIYSVSGQTSPDTFIDSASGALHVGKDETAASLTITAVSHLDQSKEGTFTVTVSQPKAAKRAARAKAQ